MAKARHAASFHMNSDDLPLFSAADRNIQDEAYELWRRGDNGQSISTARTDTAKNVVQTLNHNQGSDYSTIVDEDVLFSEDTPIGLNTPYQCDGELSGNIGVLRIEHHEFYNVAIIEIAHSYPGTPYIHKGNKYNPESGKHDGPGVQTPKISKGTTRKKRYRIQYVSGKINEGNYGVYCFGGDIKDGKRVDLNLESIVLALKEIESLALPQIGLQ